MSRRLRAGLSLHNLSEMSGMDAKKIDDLENGSLDINKFYAHEFAELSHCLNWNVDDMAKVMVKSGMIT